MYRPKISEEQIKQANEQLFQDMKEETEIFERIKNMKDKPGRCEDTVKINKPKRLL